MGAVDQHFASRRAIPLFTLRMAWTLGKAGMNSIDRAGAPMHVKDARVEIDGTTKRSRPRQVAHASPACPQAAYVLQVGNISHLAEEIERRLI